MRNVRNVRVLRLVHDVCTSDGLKCDRHGVGGDSGAERERKAGAVGRVVRGAEEERGFGGLSVQWQR